MKFKNEQIGRRELRLQRYAVDLTVVGGGMAGICCAVTAARQGLKVVLIQDRPVLGGNASSEVRLWILGATSHMGNNNRWSREGGVIDEILVENMFRNPEGNPLIVDTILLEKVISEPNITLLLNTAVHDLIKSDPETIKMVRAFCPQNATAYEVTSPLFCDASGDGIVGFIAGAAFRMGAEARAEFGEKFAPEVARSHLLGSTIYFYSKDTGRPVKYIPPNYALKDITRIPRWKDFNANDHGCRLWWIEWGGQLDSVHEAEAIKWELWKVVYGVWDHIKNSGRFPEAETLTLEWVGTIPGKRESRRFEGEYMLVQQDIVEQRSMPDAVSYGGWAIDLHPSDGIFSKKAGCTQWHSKGIYQIPYRCLYSRNIRNLFLAGRLISVSHIAFGSTRVMATCAHNAQAVAVAAALCVRHGVKPMELVAHPYINVLQQELLKCGQHIPGHKLKDPSDLVHLGTLRASSELKLAELQPNGEMMRLVDSWAMLLPAMPGRMPLIQITADVECPTTLIVYLSASLDPDNYTPENVIGTIEVKLIAGNGQKINLPFDATIDEARYVFICFIANTNVSLWLSDQRITGVLSLTNKAHHAVAKTARQEPPVSSGFSSFEFWIPQRRPGGKNFAMRIMPSIDVFSVANLSNGITRPTSQPNAWVADFNDPNPTVSIFWGEPQSIRRIELVFDTDYDHPMESVLLGHPERIIPFCVQQIYVKYRSRAPQPNGNAFKSSSGSAKSKMLTTMGVVVAVISETLSHECNPAKCLNIGGDESNVHIQQESSETDTFTAHDILLCTIKDNYKSRQTIRFQAAIITDRIDIIVAQPGTNVPAALFEVRCYNV